jgi:hypothetical protein
MINELAQKAHQNQVSKGFVEDGKPRNFGEIIALIHSELSEALEGHREGVKNPDFGQKFAIEREVYSIDSTKQPTPVYDEFKKCPAFEYADAIIRLLGSFEELGWVDLEWYIKVKMLYNSKRPHKHGKAY